jgi:hypothetical protein
MQLATGSGELLTANRIPVLIDVQLSKRGSKSDSVENSILFSSEPEAS